MSGSLNLNKESSNALQFGFKSSVIQGSALQQELNCKYIFKVTCGKLGAVQKPSLIKRCTYSSAPELGGDIFLFNYASC